MQGAGLLSTVAISKCVLLLSSRGRLYGTERVKRWALPRISIVVVFILLLINGQIPPNPFRQNIQTSLVFKTVVVIETKSCSLIKTIHQELFLGSSKIRPINLRRLTTAIFTARQLC